jgi:hypothetical protein
MQRACCASPIRLSDSVGILRHDYEISIHMEPYEDDTKPIFTRFGVYTLLDRIKFLGEVNPAGKTAARQASNQILLLRPR